jgi:hypothetical protein
VGLPADLILLYLYDHHPTTSRLYPFFSCIATGVRLAFPFTVAEFLNELFPFLLLFRSRFRALYPSDVLFFFSFLLTLDDRFWLGWMIHATDGNLWMAMI